jgi:hypothetical protein
MVINITMAHADTVSAVLPETKSPTGAVWYCQTRNVLEADTFPRWVDPSFAHAYLKWCLKHHTPANVAIISQDTKGFWLGDSTAEYVLVYFHGMTIMAPPVGPFLTSTRRWICIWRK